MERFDEILTNLQLKHTDGQPFDLAKHTEMQCAWDNDREGYLNKNDGYNCELCKNKGYLYRVSEEGFVVQRDCHCRKIRDILNKAKQSGLGNILQDNTFDKYNAAEEWQQNMKNPAQEFCKDENAKFIYYGGQSGCGKTHLCTAISGYYINQGLTVKYMLWKDDAQRIKALANEAELYQKEIAPFKFADVLCIDDFWKVKNGSEPTVGDVNVAIEIINSRIINGRITIISSEYTIQEALEIDEAVAGRIYKAAGKYKISIPKDITKNYRLKE